MAKIILTDSCFWLGLVNPDDQYHKASNVLVDLLEGQKILLPWPCLYETISTRLVRRKERLLYLEELLKKYEIELIEDTKYREKAFSEVFEVRRKSGYTFSLTDVVIREILRDINVKIHYLITFNERDFTDICALRDIEVLNK